jgi:hypothetical protein
MESVDAFYIVLSFALPLPCQHYLTIHRFTFVYDMQDSHYPNSSLDINFQNTFFVCFVVHFFMVKPFQSVASTAPPDFAPQIPLSP